VIAVVRRDDPRDEAFTVAHELAHAAGVIESDICATELACDRVAAALLVPRIDLMRALADTHSLTSICKTFSTAPRHVVAIRVAEICPFVIGFLAV